MTQLAKYDEARNALAVCWKVDEAKAIRDKAEALRAYAKQANDKDMEVWAAEIKVRANRRIGEISMELEKAKPAGRATLSPPGGLNKNEALADAGITKQFANRCEHIAAIPEQEFEQFVAEKRSAKSPPTSKQLLSKLAKDKKTKDRQRERKASVSKIQLHGNIRLGNFAESLSDIPDSSIDLIFTDPPYDRDSLSLYGELGKLAARVLVVGGSLITYFGQSMMPEVIDNLQLSGLKYRWLLCIAHEYSRARIKTPQVYVSQKPLLWFSKGVPFQLDFIADLIRSEKPNKDAHDWQQSTVEAAYLIDKLTPKGGIVLDPMCGSGTTLIAAKSLGRKWIGAEIDEVNAKLASKAISAA